MQFEDTGLYNHQAEFILSAKTADEARQKAIDFQAYQGMKSMSYLELATYQAAFTKLAEKFPELAEEFKENAII